MYNITPNVKLSSRLYTNEKKQKRFSMSYANNDVRDLNSYFLRFLLPFGRRNDNLV